ncbi:hypothetical protein CCR75_006610 [Bremia lactucae]|uniref:Store-operated calcium entry regulator STIMATE n=1 Tax=Bremia lactucae TaxID=4779 RepID=A0A976ICK2_BRELC|nr:hypothetical protein CCR75_006610 [Bremia lactucae]
MKLHWVESFLFGFQKRLFIGAFLITRKILTCLIFPLNIRDCYFSTKILAMSSSCTLVADRTDDAVQMLLGFLALSSLYAKWHYEHPRRPAKVWFMDAMKQGTSAAMIHVLNIFYAIGLVTYSDTPSDQDQCAFYFMNVVIDTTLGVYIAYLLLQASTVLAVRQHWISLRYHGYYGSPPSWQIWGFQLLQWCTILISMKVFVGVILFTLSTPLGWMGSLLFYPVHQHPKIELLIVMIGCPLVMNMVQFWIQDSFLMNHDVRRSEDVPLLSPLVDRRTPLQKPRGLSSSSNAADMYEYKRLRLALINDRCVPLCRRTHPREAVVRIN